MMWDCTKKFFAGFCSQSSVHGVKYFIKDKKIVSRCYWCCMLIFSVYCCVQFTQLLSSRYMSNPIRMTIKNKKALTENLPLPAITFCTENPTTDEWHEKFLDNITLPSGYTRDSVLDAVRHAVDGMSLLFKINRKEMNTSLLAMVDNVLQFNQIKSRDFMSQVSIPCDVLLGRCQLRGEVLPCEDIFTRVRGQCCQFIDKAENYQSSGQVHGNNLKVVSTRDHGNAYFMVHNANSEPLIDRSHFSVANGYYLMFHVDPTQILKSKEVRGVGKKHECVHPHDLGLRYFKEYNTFNCAVELAINISLALCDCVPTYYPVPDEITCNFTHMNCIQKHSVINKKIFPYKPGNIEQYILDLAKRKDIHMWDQCLELCDYTTYHLNLRPRQLFPAHDCTGFVNDMDPENEYLIQFSYESQFYTVKEFVLVNDWINLLSNIGGVCGLFLGCSMMTLAEIIFYLWKSFKMGNETQTQRLH